MWFRRRGGPLGGHIRTGLISSAMHQLHMALSGLLLHGQVITEEGMEGGRHVVPLLCPLFI